jgi:hypothetical protein
MSVAGESLAIIRLGQRPQTQFGPIGVDHRSEITRPTLRGGQARSSATYRTMTLPKWVGVGLKFGTSYAPKELELIACSEQYCQKTAYLRMVAAASLPHESDNPLERLGNALGTPSVIM